MYERSHRKKRSSSVPILILLAVILLCCIYLAWRFFSPSADEPPVGNTAEVSQSPSASSPPETSPSGSPSTSPDASSSDSPSAGASADPSPSPSASSSDPPSTSTSADPSPSTSDELPWYLTLVNPSHSLPENFSVELSQIGNTRLSIDSRAYQALRDMINGCRDAGLQPYICSAYRTQETQEKLFQNKVNEFKALGYDDASATQAAGRIVAVPGTSEHQLGLAVDIVDTTYQLLDEGQENTAVQKWLMEHCWEYGFILRYPNDKGAITQIIYEPWHYRYVGLEDAKAITESGLCLEEYLSLNYGIE